ncbi:FAD-binding oxidoreductase [Salinirubellus salinus]|uniref:FAD-binding oxidoreductase n=1 Tax=Salinirubellus salinus TaxID=1364945 RepID=A0A9E7R3K7_9EURY|nr:FAD-dependent oxidoreductase [Salinirubellus salinus]UWM54896.1 FAD-binding oxidoreductase [Salinirubellus salinus]
MRVAVVGAGAVGVTAAHALAERDADVVLFEAGAVASGSSGRAAGVCYDAFADRVDAELADRSLARFRDLSGAGGFTFTDCPYVWLAREGDERHARAIREGVARMRDHDRAVSLLDAAALGERFPTLEADVAVAAVAEDAGYADPDAYTRAVAGLAERAGVDLRTRVPAGVREGPRVETHERSESFDAVLVAAGVHTRRVVESLAPLPVKPYRVQALTTTDGPETPMLYDATEGYYCRPHGDGLLVGDGTEPVEQHPDVWDREADDWFVAACTGYETRAFDASWPVERAWAGLCTATPDGHPLAGALPGVDGVFVATGWQGHGFMRAPATGERLAEQVLGGKGIPPFDPGRFDGDEPFEIVEGMAVEERLSKGE